MLSNPGSFDAASLERPSPSQENYVQPNLGHGLRIWWAYYWPTSLISFFIIVVLTVLLRKAWENDTLSTQVVLWANRILPYVVISAVSMLGIWRIMAKKFRSFSIALLPRAPVSSGVPLSRSFQRTLRVWWEFIWRNVVYSVIFRIAGSIALSLTIGILAALGGPMGSLVTFVSQVLIDGAVGLFVIYSAILDEEFGDFRVTLVPRAVVLSPAPAVDPAAPNSLP
ncbi:MAG TPA: hypothetical protein VH114_03455 [Candidatus Acidoferrum sp.]|jgi:hypothetical protein|nr:hypothetical protein [Candidatus Acidoferrum sp.]